VQLSGATGIAAGRYRSAAVMPDGSVWQWGTTHNEGGGGGVATPTQMSGLAGVTDIALGYAHNLALATLGTLRVVSSPAVPTQITVDNNTADTYGVSYMKVLPGYHVVTFSHVEGFIEPAPFTSVLVNPGQTTTVTGNFVQRAFLHVTTSPAVPGTIYVDGIPRNDWGMWTDFPVGNHTVCFGTVVGLTAPPCQDVDLKTSGATISGTYT